MEQITIDAKNQILGRLATKISIILQGKDEPSYEKHKPGEKRALIINVSQIKFSGKKFQKKIYRHHTGWIGHLKERKLKDIWNKNPKEILYKAVYGMLPKNKLRDKRMRRLQIEL